MRWILTLALAGCATVDEVPTWTPPTQAELDPTFTDCADGATCTVVELGCCDQCNGGAAVAVREDQVSAVNAAHAETCGERQGCTERGCAPISASCQDDRCVLVESP